MPEKSKTKYIDIIRANGGQIRMSDAIDRGISRWTLYKLLENGIIEQLSRGIYRLKDLQPLSNPDLVTVALRAPGAVICLISALSFHDITTQIPRRVYIAIPKKSIAPRISIPPVSVHWFSDDSFQCGIESHIVDNVSIKVYSPEKTIVDCFKFRNQIGLDIVLEAVKLYHDRKKINVNSLMNFARICRVDKKITPYLEAIL